MNKVTIYDIARELNTSASTVSRALQDNPRISAKMKKAVHELAEKMNFHPDPIAHHLRTGKGSVLGVIVPRIDRHYFASVIGGIEQVAHDAGFSVIVSQSNERYEDEISLIKTMMAKKIDGLAVSLASATTQYDHFNSIIARGVPVVFFDRVPLLRISGQVQIDNYSASYNAVNHLIEQGCRRIAHLAGPQNISVYRLRQDGYKNAIIDAGLEPDNSLIISNSITQISGEEAACKLLAMPNRPDGIFAAGDYSALGLMHVLKKNGVKIPQDMAVVGFANEPFDTYVDPPLSSVDQMNNETGRKVAEQLIKLIGQKTVDRQYEDIVLESALFKRDSSLRNK